MNILGTAILALATLGVISAALGQSSTHKTGTPTNLAAAPVDRLDLVIIKYGRGGRVDEHTLRFADYRLKKTRVELRGPCLSACTIVLAYVGPELLCVAPDGYMAFHAVRSMENRELMPLETKFLYSIYPQRVRDWIDRNGGWQKLPLDGFWTMHSGELWAMGYPKCL